MCRSTMPGIFTRVGIFENPGAIPAYRFIYTKWTNKYSEPVFPQTIGWLKPFSVESPPFVLADLTAEETAFWESAVPMPSNIKVTEYIPPPEAQNKDPYGNDWSWKYVPPEANPTRMPSTQGEKPSIEDQLRSIGDELKKVVTDQGGYRVLYRDGRILFDHVIHVSDVYKFQTEAKPITAFLVETIPTVGPIFLNRFLVQNDAIYHWSFTNNDPPLRTCPVCVGEPLWWLRF